MTRKQQETAKALKDLQEQNQGEPLQANLLKKLEQLIQKDRSFLAVGGR